MHLPPACQVDDASHMKMEVYGRIRHVGVADAKAEVHLTTRENGVSRQLADIIRCLVVEDKGCLLPSIAEVDRAGRTG
jgi:hypothetical protein